LASESAKTARSIEKLTNEYEQGAITVDRYEKELSTLSLRQNSLIKQQDRARRSVRSYNASLLQLSGGYRVAGKTTAKALPAVQEFGRAIQDAPFGIIGVGNNLTQLGDAFGVLSRKVGGGRAALALFGRALLGPAGLLVAFSAVISIITVFSRRTRESTDELEELKKKGEELNKVFSSRVDLSKSQLKLSESLGEATDFQRLQVAEDLKLQALKLDAFNDQNRALLQQIKLQNLGLTEKLAGFYELSAEAKQKEADATTQINTTQSKINKLLAEANDILNDIVSAREEANQKIEGITAGIARGVIGFQIGIVATGNTALEKTDVLLTRLGETLTEFEVRALKATENINNAFSEGLASTLGDFAFAVGDAFAKGANVLQAGARALFAGFGRILNTVGDTLIKTGISIEIFKKSLAGLGGIGMIAAGVALKAFAGTISGAVGGLGRTSGSVGTSSVSGQGQGSFRGSISSSGGGGGLAGGGEVVFRISGTNLIGVIDRTLKGKNKTVSDVIG